MSNRDLLYINGQLIEKFKIQNNDIDESDSLVIDLPDYLLIEKKNADRIVIDLDEDDVEKLGEVVRVDTDKYLNKKVRLYIQVLGQAKR